MKVKVHPLIRQEMKKQLNDGSFWYRQHYKLTTTDERFLNSCEIDWHLDYEMVTRVQEQADGNGSTLEVETDEDLSELDLENDEFWDKLMKENNAD